MLSTFFGLEIARRGMQGGRKAMDITAHNLANVNTPGYTRQDPEFRSELPYTLPNIHQRLLPGQMGTGTYISSIRRIRDQLLDRQVRSAYGENGFWNERSDALERIQVIFPEPSDIAVRNEIGTFFSAWHELNNSPTDPGLKEVVRSSAEVLTTHFRQTYKNVEDVRESMETRINDLIEEINDVAEEVASLNEKIHRIVMVGNQPNDLYDRRDYLIDKLSKIGPVEITEDNFGQIGVSIWGCVLISADANGIYRVNDTVSANINAGTDELTVDFALSGASAPITAGAVGYTIPGSLAGAENARQRIKDYLDELDELANAIRDEVNAIHLTGSSGVEFFDPASTGARDFTLSAAIRTDVNNVAGDVALEIAQLRHQLTMSAGTATFEGFYKTLVVGIGSDLKGAGNRYEGTEAMVKELEDLRQSIMGVSIDEELTRLTQFNYAFQASARVATVMDSMLDTLINRMAV